MPNNTYSYGQKQHDFAGKFYNLHGYKVGSHPALATVYNIYTMLSLSEDFWWQSAWQSAE